MSPATNCTSTSWPSRRANTLPQLAPTAPVATRTQGAGGFARRGVVIAVAALDALGGARAGNADVKSTRDSESAGRLQLVRIT